LSFYHSLHFTFAFGLYKGHYTYPMVAQFSTGILAHFSISIYIYHQCKFKDIALTRLARWYDEVDKSGFLTFGRVARSIQTHYLDIINFFERRATNAAAESFNAKIKAFRAQFRGVRDRAFFLYRLAKLYA
ncbi:transposase, partial [Bacteroides stercoris]|uniref:transposase n=1 Tax=Bacteroides stercoris TaxID=46506 RepID=UPI0021AB8F04